MVKPGKGPLHGVVTFYVNGLVVGHAAVNSAGLAVLTLKTHKSGDIEASFAGTNFLPSHT